MSRWDEYDRMLERIEQGKLNRKEIEPIKYSDEALSVWKNSKNKVIDNINKGTTHTDEWVLRESGWVDFISGANRGCSFHLPSEVEGKK